MSRLGKLPIKITEGVKVEIDGQKVSVTGPKGSLSLALPKGLEVAENAGELLVVNKMKSKQSKANHGTHRLLIENMVKGVVDGWKKELEIVGTGYRAAVEGKKLILTIGFSHPVEIAAPEGIAFSVDKSNIVVEGIDKHLVGQIAANIRAVRPPEPYKGKGIKYIDEYVRRKPGKAAKAGAE